VHWTLDIVNSELRCQFWQQHFSCAEEEPEDFYDFTAEDYARIMASRKEGIFCLSMLSFSPFISVCWSIAWFIILHCSAALCVLISSLHDLAVEIYLKTKKIREQEQAARRAHMTKVRLNLSESWNLPPKYGTFFAVLNMHVISGFFLLKEVWWCWWNVPHS